MINIIENSKKYAPSGRKYLSLDAIKYHFKWEEITKLDKNAHKKLY